VTYRTARFPETTAVLNLLFYCYLRHQKGQQNGPSRLEPLSSPVLPKKKKNAETLKEYLYIFIINIERKIKTNTNFM
jgi:hypothetical protein